MGYLVPWRSHSNHQSAWDYINTDMDIENYVKLYSSKHFDTHPGMTEELQKQQLDHIINSLAMID